MHKSVYALATIAVTLLSTSAYYAAPADGRVGYQAPSLTLERDGETLSLSQYRGRHVVVTFWSSSQPASRIDNLALDRAARRHGVAHLSVNMDMSAAMHRQLLVVDGLSGLSQCHCDSASQDRLRRTWRQDGGYCSFLVDPQGRIVLKDPTEEDLARL